jgi:cell division protein FtsZ
LLDTSIEGAKGILLSFCGGPDMGLLEINEAASMVADMADPEANIIFGAVIDDKMTDEIRVTIIATGFEPKRAKPGAARIPSQPEIAPIPKFKGATLEIPDWMKRK